MPDRARSGIFYGWVIVAALAIVLAVGVGITFYGLAIYLAALSQGPAAFSLSMVSTATGIFLLVGGAAGIPVAWLLERIDPRLVIVGGLFVSAGAVMCIGHVWTAWQLMAAYGVLGVGFAAISVIPTSKLVAAWFVRRRTLAMSITFTGLPIGGALLSPVVATLVESRGVAGAAPWLAVTLLVAVPVALLLHPGPSSSGSTPDGDPIPASTSGGVTGVPLREAVRSGWFIVVTTALTFGMLSQLGVLSHLYSAVEQRLDVTVAAAAISTLAAASLVGRIAGGWLLSHVRLQHATVGFLTLQGIAIVGLALAPNTWSVFTATAVFGLTMGNMQIIQPLLLAERFGNRDYSRILARGNLVVMVGMAAGPVLLGMLHEVSGGYLSALAIGALPSLTGAALMLWSSRLGTPVPDVDRNFALLTTHLPSPEDPDANRLDRS